MPHLTLRRRFLLAIPVLLLAIYVAAKLFWQSPPPDLDLSLSKSTNSGLYIVELEPEAKPLAVGPMHSWTVALSNPTDTSAIEEARIGIDGGMPQHGHGLPTSPAVTRALGKGRFLIEGMKFNMPGWWVIALTIDGPAGADTVTFNIVL